MPDLTVSMRESSSSELSDIESPSTPPGFSMFSHKQYTSPRSKDAPSPCHPMMTRRKSQVGARQIRRSSCRKVSRPQTYAEASSSSAEDEHTSVLRRSVEARDRRRSKVTGRMRARRSARLERYEMSSLDELSHYSEGGDICESNELESSDSRPISLELEYDIPVMEDAFAAVQFTREHSTEMNTLISENRSYTASNYPAKNGWYQVPMTQGESSPSRELMPTRISGSFHLQNPLCWEQELAEHQFDAQAEFLSIARELRASGQSSPALCQNSRPWQGDLASNHYSAQEALPPTIPQTFIAPELNMLHQQQQYNIPQWNIPAQEQHPAPATWAPPPTSNHSTEDEPTDLALSDSDDDEPTDLALSDYSEDDNSIAKSEKAKKTEKKKRATKSQVSFAALLVGDLASKPSSSLSSSASRRRGGLRGPRPRKQRSGAARRRGGGSL